MEEEAPWLHTPSENIRDTVKNQRLEQQDSPSETLSLTAPTSCSRNEGVRWDTTSMIGYAPSTN
jgi:hypothetical protein